MTWKAHLLSALLGALSVFAFAPFELYVLAFFAIAGLAYLMKGASPKTSALLGFSFGIGLYLFGVSWVYVSLSTYGGMPLWMGVIAVIGFASILAVFTGLSTFIASYVSARSNLNFLMLLPFSWVIGEWCRSWVLTGFPWMDFGYTQVPSWLLSWGAIGGVYLVSFFVVFVATAAVMAYSSRSLVAGFAIGTLFLLSFMIQGVKWTEVDGPPLQVGVVQANIPIDNKWVKSMQNKALAQYQSLSSKLAESKLDLVVWPETAIPYYAKQTDTEFWQAMSPEGVAVLAGLLDYDGVNSYNAAALSCADARGQEQIYRKRHLVPFGEYQPLQFLFSWVFDYLALPMSDFAGWEGMQTLDCDGRIKIGLSICYEDAFADEYRVHLGEANLLINISEDAWFGDSFAPHQRTQFAQMRARELGRPMVRAANSGPSLFIDDMGTLLEATAQFEVAIASRDVQAMQGRTPFMRFGSWIVWLSLIVLIGLRAYAFFKERR